MTSYMKGVCLHCRWGGGGVGVELAQELLCKVIIIM